MIIEEKTSEELDKELFKKIVMKNLRILDMEQDLFFHNLRLKACGCVDLLSLAYYYSDISYDDDFKNTILKNFIFFMCILTSVNLNKYIHTKDIMKNEYAKLCHIKFERYKLLNEKNILNHIKDNYYSFDEFKENIHLYSDEENMIIK